MIKIINLQKIKKIRLKYWQETISRGMRLLGVPSRDVSVVFCGNKFISSLNKKYFSRKGPTDVISFNLEDDFDSRYLGDVVVSIQEAERLAFKFGHSWEEETALYVIHGILHLLGWDDTTALQRADMGRKQAAIMSRLFSKKETI